jgi:hypothetical protein
MRGPTEAFFHWSSAGHSPPFGMRYVPLDRNRKDIMRYKSKHNLLRWFIEDQRTLPASYVKSCRKFFKEISKQQASSKHQATSIKLQAASVKLTQRQTKNNE